MIIPAKYQWSRDNDPDNSSRINNITKKYIICIKKFSMSYNNTKSQMNNNNQNQPYNFQNQVLEWFFKLPLIERIKVSTINNKWVFQTLHQLYIEQKNKPNLKFIPRINEKSPFLQKLAGKDIFADNPSHFLNYFAFSSQNHELIKGFNEKIEKDFITEINFFYPDLVRISKIKINGKEILPNLNKYYYPVFILNETLLTNREKFIKYFKALSNNHFFVSPPEMIATNKQNEQSEKNEENINLINSFNSINPLNNAIKNFNNNNDNYNNNNSNNNSGYNNRIQNMIDLPKWAKQPINTTLCFSISELFLAFFEQNIFVHFILYNYDKSFYDSLLSDYSNTTLEEFISLKTELKEFLFINKENLLDLLNIDKITKEIYYNADIEKFVNIKKYQDNLISKTKVWKENINYEEEYSLIKEYFNGYNNDNKSMIRLINDITTFNIEQIYTFEDFFFNTIFFTLNKKYENNKEVDLISDLTSKTNNITNNNGNKNKKKRKRKKKKKKDNEDKQEDNDNNIDEINEEKKDEENKGNNIINIKKFINIEEDEELTKIKKGYIKLETSDNNLCESSGSENNCDSKPLLPNKDMQQIMKEKENKYNSNDENIEINENENINNINNININDIKKEESNNDKIEKEINIINDEVNKEKDIIINIQDNKSNNNNNKKKKTNFFLYPTTKKNNTEKIIKPPFIMKLNEDILSYNKTLNMILDSLSRLKEYIIEKIKSHIKECFFGENYQIDIYGSFKSHLDIVCSDIDMIFIPQKTKNVDVCELIHKLSNHFSGLKEYYKVTPIYTASIPLIKLMIKYENYLSENKTLLNNFKKLINSEIYKNYPFEKEKEILFMKIDISFPVYNNLTKKNKNSPFHQIEYIKKSLSSYSEADIVIRILKRALKLTDLNNSYKGGLSSYTLFLMVISFLKNINKNSGTNNKYKKNNYGHAFHDVAKFFSKFDFYSNVIDVENKNGDIFLKRNKKYSSPEFENIPVILDPVTGQNAGKSSFRINAVQNAIIAINDELEKLRNIYDNDTDNKDNNDKKENIYDNLIITLLKNVEKGYKNF